MPPKSDKKDWPEQVIRFTSGGAKFKVELRPGAVTLLRQRPSTKHVKDAAGRVTEQTSKSFVSIGQLTFALIPETNQRELRLNGAFTLHKLPIDGKTRQTKIKLLMAAEQIILGKHPKITTVIGNVVDMRDLRKPLDVGTIFNELNALKQKGGKFALARATHERTVRARQNARKGVVHSLPEYTPKKQPAPKKPGQRPRHGR